MARVFLRLKNNRGVALIAGFLVITALLIYCAAFVSVGINQNMTADRFKRGVNAFNLAESGLDHAVTWLRTQSVPPVGDQVDPWGSIQSVGGGEYTVTITDLGIVGASSDIRRYKITATGTFKNIIRVLSNYVQVDNFARYTWFTESETFSGYTVWFWTQDRLNGPTHTNAHFNIFQNPVFEGEASSVDDYIRFYNNGNNINLSQTTNPPHDLPDFQQGMDFGVEPTVMPNQALSLRAAAADGGLSLRGYTSVVLNSDGTMNVTNSRRGWSNQNMPLPANGALFVNRGSLNISGTLDGSLTVGASRDVIIPNDIVYADDPRVNPNSDDVLGIIAERDVMVDDNAPDNLEIDACMMALDTSFMRENWWVGPPKDTLTVYGGIIQDERGPIGTFNGSTGQKMSGYSKDYSYDPRLMITPPPFMPTTGDYVTLSWEED